MHAPKHIRVVLPILQGRECDRGGGTPESRSAQALLANTLPLFSRPWGSVDASHDAPVAVRNRATFCAEAVPRPQGVNRLHLTSRWLRKYQGIIPVAPGDSRCLALMKIAGRKLNCYRRGGDRMPRCHEPLDRRKQGPFTTFSIVGTGECRFFTRWATTRRSSAGATGVSPV